MGYMVNGEELLRLTRELIESFMEWGDYQTKTEKDPVSKAYNRDCWAQEVGKCTAYLHAFSVITGTFQADVDAKMRAIVGADTNQDNVTRYAFQLAEALDVNLDD